MPMNTELTLRDACGKELSVVVEGLTPMGFETVISQPALADLRDDTGRFRAFDLHTNAMADDCLGQCRVHSVRRICADKCMLCLRFDGPIPAVYDRLCSATVALTEMNRKRA